jgi:GntR family transcriptional regulator
MFFSIEPNNGVPIYEQIVRQIKFAVAEQTLKSGQLLSSVRTLSQQLAINPNTINRAFQQLQADGVLESIRGKGMAVRAEAFPICIDSRRQIIADRFRSVIAEALHAGLGAEELQSLVADQISAMVGMVDTVSSKATASPSV